jgi:putative heme-binding domain-containing protein
VSTDAIIEARSLVDSDGQVRLAAFLALAEMPPSAEAASAIAAAIGHPENASDRWIPDAMTSAAAQHEEHFLAALASLRGKAAGQAVLAIIATRVAEHHARGDSSESTAGIVASLAKAERPVVDSVITGLEKGWGGNKSLVDPGKLAESIVPVLEKLSPENKGKLVSLANRWRVEGLEKFTTQIASGYLEVASDGKRSDSDRASAARQLVEFLRRDDETVDNVIGLIQPTISFELSKGLLAAISASQSPRVGTAIVEAAGGMTPAVKREAQLVLLKQREWTRAFLEGAKSGDIDISLLTLDQKQALARHPDKDIRATAKTVLAASGELPNPDRQKVIDEVLAALAKKSGDAKKGKESFTKVCAKCHTHSGEGTKIGPDLTGVAVHPASELAVHILDPSRSVEGNYRQYTVVTTKGRTLTGMLASETKTSIEIFDAEGKKTIVLREDIARLDGSRLSLMPAGFEKEIGIDGLVDLLAFLTKRGKYLPLPLDKAATIVTTKGMFYTEASRHERIVFKDWKPKTFDGIPFHLVDPQGERVPNAIMLHSPNGTVSSRMPKSAVVACNATARVIHLLSGVSGWGWQGGDRRTISMVVRLHYADGKREDHKLIDGVHFSDYIRKIEVPGSKLAFMINGRQLRYLAIYPKRAAKIRDIEFVKGRDRTAPIVMSVTLESAD